MKCPHCEKEIAGIACPECYEESPEGADFCMKCGASLATPEPGEGGGDEFETLSSGARNDRGGI